MHLNHARSARTTAPSFLSGDLSDADDACAFETINSEPGNDGLWHHLAPATVRCGAISALSPYYYCPPSAYRLDIVYLAFQTSPSCLHNVTHYSAAKPYRDNNSICLCYRYSNRQQQCSLHSRSRWSITLLSSISILKRQRHRCRHGHFARQSWER